MITKVNFVMMNDEPNVKVDFNQLVVGIVLYYNGGRIKTKKKLSMFTENAWNAKVCVIGDGRPKSL